MWLLKFVEFALIVMFITVLVTQVIVPVMRNRAMFPAFRKQGKLETELAELNQRKVEAELEKKIQTMKGDKHE